MENITVVVWDAEAAEGVARDPETRGLLQRSAVWLGGARMND